MSKVKLLLDVVNDIRHLADSLECVANSIVENTPESPCQEGDSSAKKHTSPSVTIDQVHAALAEKSGDGKTAEVKALLYKYDAGKLSGVKPEDYAALLEEAQKL